MKKLISLLLSCIMVISIMTSFCFTAQAEEFSDLNKNRYVTAIEFMNEMGIFPAYVDGTFHPESSVSRSDALSILHHMFTGSTKPADKYVKEASKYKDIKTYTQLNGIVNWAFEKKIVSATGTKKFNPSTGLTVKEYVGLFVRAFGLYEQEKNQIYNFDYDFQMALGTGLLSFFRRKGYNSGDPIPEGESAEGYADMQNLEADNPITRAEAAQIAYNFFTMQDVEGVTVEIGGQESKVLSDTVFLKQTVGTKIVATKNRPFGKKFDGDVLLENGLVLNSDKNYDDYVGYNVTLMFRDEDLNGKYTAGEHIYSWKPTTVIKEVFYLDDPETSTNIIKNALILSADDAIIEFFSSAGFTEINIKESYTEITLNEGKWPKNSPEYDFDTIYKRENLAKDQTMQIKDRPGFKMEVFSDGGGIVADRINCYESKAGKILDNNGEQISVYDFYADEVKTFDATKIKSNTQFNVGDCVGFALYGDGYVHFEDTVKTEKYNFVSQKAKEVTAVNSNNEEVVLSKSKFFRSLGYNPKPGSDIYIISDSTGVIALSDINDKGAISFKYVGTEGSVAKIQLLNNGSVIEVPASSISQAIKDSGYGIYKFNGQSYVVANGESVIGSITELNSDYIEIIVDGDNGLEVKRIELSGNKDLSLDYSIDAIDKNSLYIVVLDAAKKVIGYTKSSGAEIASYKKALELVPYKPQESNPQNNVMTDNDKKVIEEENPSKQPESTTSTPEIVVDATPEVSVEITAEAKNE